MNYLRKIRKNAKALSPVVASIILIAVTVAVSIAVAAWMGQMSTGFMQTEQVQINTLDFTIGDATNGRIQVEVLNTGTSAITISDVQVNGASAATNMTTTTRTISANGKLTIEITSAVTAGYNYQVKVVTSKNNAFVTSSVAT